VVIKSDKEEKETIPRESETLKLKRLILTFKKKYQHALQDLAKKERDLSSGESHTVRKHREAQEENFALIDQQNALKELLRKANEANEGKDERINMLEKSFREKKISTESKIFAAKEKTATLEKNQLAFEEQNQIFSHRVEKLMTVVKEQEKRISELQRYEYSFQKMGNFNQKLEEDCERLNNTTQQLKHEKDLLVTSLEERGQQLEQLEGAKESLQKREKEAKVAQKKIEEQAKELAQMKQRSKEQEEQLGSQGKEKQCLEKKLERETCERQKSEREWETMKQTLVQTVCEMREIKQLYQNIAGEKAGELKKTAHMHSQLQKAFKF